LQAIERKKKQDNSLKREEKKSFANYKNGLK
jgi:hypothetical protein